jgi:hypothetical protein
MNKVIKMMIAALALCPLLTFAAKIYFVTDSIDSISFHYIVCIKKPADGANIHSYMFSKEECDKEHPALGTIGAGQHVLALDFKNSIIDEGAGFSGNIGDVTKITITDATVTYFHSTEAPKTYNINYSVTPGSAIKFEEMNPPGQSSIMFLSPLIAPKNN